MVLWSKASTLDRKVVGSNPRQASIFYRVVILTKNSLAFDEKRREEEEESCRRGLSSREDAAMIGIRQLNLKREWKKMQQERSVGGTSSLNG